VTASLLAITSLARRYRLERALTVLLLGLAIGVLLGGIAHWFGAGDRARWIVVAVTAGIGIGFAVWRDRREQVTAGAVARHLDRKLPELEESATLLVDSTDRSPLDALQRQRVLARWDVHRAAAVMPHHGSRRTIVISIPFLVIGLWLSRGAAPMRGAHSAWSSDGASRVTLQRLEVQLAPPAYTGVKKHQVDAADGIDAEEGSALAWQLRTAGNVEEAWLLLSRGDSLPFSRAGDGQWTLATVADRSQLVRVRIRGGDSLSLLSDDYRLAVRPDKPPLLTIVEPGERTTIPPGTLPRVPVAIRAVDDYGVDQVTMNATIASGRGEAVRFRRLQLPLGARTRDPEGGERIGGMIDLHALGMGPGDELYFHIEATDRRTPIANRAHSETVFLSIEDTTRAPSADLAKLALNAQPEYFRSQRQLIIDTEKLLAEQSRITVTAFRDRANEIGIDQGLLRLRYGQFLGEEFEEQAAEMGGREHAAAEAGAEAQKALDAAEGGKAQTADDAREAAKGELQHKHDDAENATLLGNRVKGMLRTAVGAMWQAELHLRTAEPKRALPYMHQALDLIKAIQQDARVYVQRVGFEPPPIEVEKLRLSAKLTGINDRRVRASSATRDTLPAIRRAMQLLDGEVSDSLPIALQAAGNELAVLAIDDPRLLPVLKATRELLDALQAGRRCAECVERVRRGFWTALPLPDSRPGFGALAPSVLGRHFAELLRGAH
jgi:hypothetical protein